MPSNHSAEQATANKQLFTAAVRTLFVEGQLERVTEFYAPDYVQHHPERAAKARELGISDVEMTLGFFSALFEGFPDMRVDVEQLLAEDDRVMGFLSWQGTHTGDFMGVPATGKQVMIRTADLFRIEAGRFAEHWDVADESSLAPLFGAR